TVYNATDAKTAVDIARRHPTIQLFCLDIGLPDKSGALLLPELKKMLPNAEAIMITAYQSVDLMVKSFQNLARDYIIKPYDDDELVAIISKALQHRNLTLAIHQAQDSALVDRIIDSTKRTRLLQDLGEKRLLSHKALYMEDVYVFFPDLRGSGLPENQKITKKQIEDGLMLLVDSLAKTITRA
ncbi:response regulator, partial [bacterium]|nr:response regulator [bacterium]